MYRDEEIKFLLRDYREKHEAFIYYIIISVYSKQIMLFEFSKLADNAFGGYNCSN